jgi:hypothetical protein
MNAMIIDPIEIKKGAMYRIVANGGYFNYVMRATNIYNGFFMLESEAIGRQCIGWHSMRNGDVRVYRLDDPDRGAKKVEAPATPVQTQ